MHTMLWAAQLVLALIFMSSGLAQLTTSRKRMLASGQTGATAYPMPVVRLTAACEVMAAIGLTVPPVVGIGESLVGWAAVGLGVVMIGAMAVHSKLAVSQHRPREWRAVVINVGILAVCAFVAVQWI